MRLAPCRGLRSRRRRVPTWGVSHIGRFVGWIDPEGTTNNFTASATGTATPTNTVDGCHSSADDIIIIWHSDGVDHGSSPGKIGVNWHTSLIARVP